MALNNKKYLTAILALTVVVVAGCSTSRFGNNGGGNSPNTIMPMPGSSEVISQSTLMPPRNQASLAPNANNNINNGVATDTNTLANAGQNIDENSIPGFTVPQTALDLNPAMVAGVWHASIDGMVCQLATPQTKFSKGYRAAPLRCPASFMGVTSWSVMGKQLNLYKDGGKLTAVLYSTAANMFEGRSVEGEIVTLNR